MLNRNEVIELVERALAPHASFFWGGSTAFGYPIYTSDLDLFLYARDVYEQDSLINRLGLVEIPGTVTDLYEDHTTRYSASILSYQLDVHVYDFDHSEQFLQNKIAHQKVQEYLNSHESIRYLLKYLRYRQAFAPRSGKHIFRSLVDVSSLRP